MNATNETTTRWMDDTTARGFCQRMKAACACAWMDRNPADMTTFMVTINGDWFRTAEECETWLAAHEIWQW